jgi:thymidylate synthase
VKSYIDLVNDVLENGVQKGDRTGTGTISSFGHQIKHDLNKGFPLMTTKKIFFKGVIHELLWMLSGSSNIKYLQDNKTRIWDEWADENGELGPVYGVQWRHWQDFIPHAEIKDTFIKGKGIDQIRKLIDTLKKDPNSRRMLVSAYNVADLPKMALEPCHTLFQFYVANSKLSCQLYQRSCDLGLGYAFNLAFYSLLTHMIASTLDMGVGHFVHTIGDAHVYLNHIGPLKEQLTRTPFDLPKIKINPEIKDIDDFKFEDIELVDYQAHPSIKMKVSV